MHPYIHCGASLVAQLVKNLPAVQETQVQTLGRERSSEKGNGKPLQYLCLENPMDRGAWRATVHRVAKSPTLLINEPTIRMLKLINTRVFYQREWGKDSFLRTTEQTLPGTLTLFMNKHL